MSTIKLKRGLEANRLGITPSEGEIIYVTDTNLLYIGDGVTAGGNLATKTAAEILAALLTVDGSGSLLDGDTIDGLEGSQIIRTDQDGTLVGELTVSDEIFAAVTQTPNANTVVDVFVYDTSKDSDGGAWRKRTTKTSWYKETLNTATRGATKGFPAVALIVAETTKVTIYNATDSTYPMWMVFLTGTNQMLWTGVIRKLTMINGYMAISSSTALQDIQFISDFGGITQQGASSRYNGSISERNTNLGIYSYDTSKTIINNTTNDVAITVLPNAPVDTETGLPIPTIAVATDGGISIVHNDGNVVDITGVVNTNNISNLVMFTPDNKLIFGSREGVVDRNIYLINYGDLPYTDDSAAHVDNHYTVNETWVYPTRGLAILSNGSQFSCLNDKGIGTAVALNLISRSSDAVSTDMINYITNSFQSGWLQGDIKGAFLANSKTTDRSVNNNVLTENGTVTESPVAAGSELMGYSGFSTINYLEQPYNADLDFGTNNFYVMGWFKTSSTGTQYLFDREDISLNVGSIAVRTASSLITLFISDDGSTTTDQVFSTTTINDNTWRCVSCVRKEGTIQIYLDGILENSTPIVEATGSLSNGSSITTIGKRVNNTNAMTDGSLALWRIGAGTPSDAQIKKIYESERHLFTEGAACTLSSTTNSSVNALAYDDTTDRLYAAGTQNSDTFKGLVRVASETGVYTSLSAHNNIVAKGN